MINLKDELKDIIRGEFLNDDKTLTDYSHDTGILEVRPQAVIFPKDSDDIKNLIKYSNLTNFASNIISK